MQKSRTVDHGRDDVVCGNFGESSALSTSLKRLIIENPEKFLDSSITAIYRRRKLGHGRSDIGTFSVACSSFECVSQCVLVAKN